MSEFSTWPDLSASLLYAPIELVLIVKWTAVLALAWLAQAMLARRNPRWRVALWRSAVVGLVMIAILSVAPPMVTYHLVDPGRPTVDPTPIDPHPAAARSASIPLPATSHEATEAVSIRGPLDAIRRTPAGGPSEVTVRRADRGPHASRSALVVAVASGWPASWSSPFG